MTYAQYGTVEAVDFNTLVGANITSVANTLNATWSTGNQNKGYGQSPTGNVTVGDTIAASKWANLVSNTASAATHQGSSITSVAVPVVGGTITYLSAIPTNLQTIYTNRLNAATVGSTVAYANVYGSTWANAVSFVHTATFANGDAARYFFNAGGQLKITCSHANVATPINVTVNGLASNIGTVVVSSPTSGTITVASTSYSGITKIGGGAPAPTPYLTNNGYYALTGVNAAVFTQAANSGQAGYFSTNIAILLKSNGTQGSNGDAGSIITIYTNWDEIPNGLIVGTGTTTTVTVCPPEQTNISNTWGTISVTSSVSGS